MSLQTNEITKSEVIQVALNKRIPVIEKGPRLLGVFLALVGKELRKLQTLTSSS